jgi:hypothetical protein
LAANVEGPGVENTSGEGAAIVQEQIVHVDVRCRRSNLRRMIVEAFDDDRVLATLVGLSQETGLPELFHGQRTEHRGLC